MIDSVKLISKLNVLDRQQALLSILRVNELPYTLFHEKIGDHWVDNIVVPFKENQGSKLIISAHYDNIAESCGANDNASGVSILIEVAKYLKTNNIDIPVDIVFFDREEYPGRGSEIYVKKHNKENLYAMINLDTCGFGDTILIGTRTNIMKSEFSSIISNKLIEKHGVEIIERNPGSDDGSFEAEGIPNVSICVVPKDDLYIIRKIIECECNNIVITPEIIPHAPEFMSTIHNGKDDCIEIVQESIMNSVLNFIIDIINNFKLNN